MRGSALCIAVVLSATCYGSQKLGNLSRKNSRNALVEPHSPEHRVRSLASDAVWARSSANADENPSGFQQVHFSPGMMFGCSWTLSPVYAGFSTVWGPVLPYVVAQRARTAKLQNVDGDDILRAIYAHFKPLHDKMASRGERFDPLDGFVNIELGLYITTDDASGGGASGCANKRRNAEANICLKSFTIVDKVNNELVVRSATFSLSPQ